MTRKTGTEINFDKRYGGGRPKGAEAAGKGAGGELVFCWSFQSDFTNEMDIWYSTGRAGSNGHPVLRFLKSPSLAIFLCVIDHFISEMTDCAQQQKTVPLSVPPSRQPPFQPPTPRLASFHYGVYKNLLPCKGRLPWERNFPARQHIITLFHFINEI